MFKKCNTDQIYDEAGLNVAAVSNIITPIKNNVIDACKPPEVEKVVQNTTPMKHQMRHSYTARLRLHITEVGRSEKFLHPKI